MFSRLPEPKAGERAHCERLLAHLRELIATQGFLSFAQYMERCLYAPGLGYYSIGTAKFGAAGDFVTAPELGTLFARCLANVLRPLLLALGEDADILEPGGGSGAMAAAMLHCLGSHGPLPHRYLILEPSADLRQRQRERLAATLPAGLLARVQWLTRPPEQGWRGVLVANEVVDALPAARFVIRNGQIYEEHVTLDESAALTRVDCAADAMVTAAVRHVEQDLGAALGEGYRSEVRPQLPCWMQAIAGTLEAGAMVFIDYGYVRREFYLPERRDGTLMAHYRHHAHNDPLWLPGLNDLTASVDFTALAEAGCRAGFDVATYLPQGPFLLAGGLARMFGEDYARIADEPARLRLAQEVKRLVLPGQMGERFQAMVFMRGLKEVALAGELRAASQAGRL